MHAGKEVCVTRVLNGKRYAIRGCNNKPKELRCYRDGYTSEKVDKIFFICDESRSSAPTRKLLHHVHGSVDNIIINYGIYT